jgi:adenine phosphoribosyltransferase
MKDDLAARVRTAIRNIPDFPQPGVLFRDVSTLLLRPDLMHEAIEAMCELPGGKGATHVVAVEARGFVFGAGIALARSLPLVLVRKPGKLPAARISEHYALEYGEGTLEMHADAIPPGARAWIVDDVLATGGTAGATGRLVRRAGGEVSGYLFLAEIEFLGGRAILSDAPVESLVRYGADGRGP